MYEQTAPGYPYNHDENFVPKNEPQERPAGESNGALLLRELIHAEGHGAHGPNRLLYLTGIAQVFYPEVARDALNPEQQNKVKMELQQQMEYLQKIGSLSHLADVAATLTMFFPEEKGLISEETQSSILQFYFSLRDKQTDVMDSDPTNPFKDLLRAQWFHDMDTDRGGFGLLRFLNIASTMKLLFPDQVNDAFSRNEMNAIVDNVMRNIQQAMNVYNIDAVIDVANYVKILFPEKFDEIVTPKVKAAVEDYLRANASKH